MTAAVSSLAVVLTGLVAGSLASPLVPQAQAVAPTGAIESTSQPTQPFTVNGQVREITQQALGNVNLNPTSEGIAGAKVYIRWMEGNDDRKQATSPWYYATTDSNGNYSVQLKSFLDERGNLRYFSADPKTGTLGSFTALGAFRVAVGSPANYHNADVLTEKIQIMTVLPDEIAPQYSELSNYAKNWEPAQDSLDNNVGAKWNVSEHKINEVYLNFVKKTDYNLSQEESRWATSGSATNGVDANGSEYGSISGTVFWNASHPNGAADFTTNAELQQGSVITGGNPDLVLKGQKIVGSYLSDEAIVAALNHAAQVTNHTWHGADWTVDDENELQQWISDQIAIHPEYIAETVQTTSDENGKYKLYFKGIYGDSDTYKGIVSNAKWHTLANSWSEGVWTSGALNSKHINADWSYVYPADQPSNVGFQSPWQLGRWLDPEGTDAWGGANFVSASASAAVTTDAYRAQDFIATPMAILFDVTPYDNMENPAKPGDTAHTTASGLLNYSNLTYEIVWTDPAGNTVGSCGPSTADTSFSLQDCPLKVPDDLAQDTVYKATLYSYDATGAKTNVGEDQFVAVVPIELPWTSVGDEYSGNAATNPPSASYTYSDYDASNLPKSLTMDKTGAISGKTDAGTEGTYKPTISKTISTTDEVTSETITAKRSSVYQLVVTDTPLADGAVGTEYTQAVKPTGFEDAGYKVQSITSVNGLPDGLTYADGQITGTPTAVTAATQEQPNVTVTYTVVKVDVNGDPVQDADGNQITKTVVDKVPLAITPKAAQPTFDPTDDPNPDDPDNPDDPANKNGVVTVKGADGQCLAKPTISVPNDTNITYAVAENGNGTLDGNTVTVTDPSKDVTITATAATGFTIKESAADAEWKYTLNEAKTVATFTVSASLFACEANGYDPDYKDIRVVEGKPISVAAPADKAGKDLPADTTYSITDNGGLEGLEIAEDGSLSLDAAPDVTANKDYTVKVDVTYPDGSVDKIDVVVRVLNDGDGDDVPDPDNPNDPQPGEDKCPNTPAGEAVNADGCSLGQLNDPKYESTDAALGEAATSEAPTFDNPTTNGVTEKNTAPEGTKFELNDPDGNFTKADSAADVDQPGEVFMDPDTGVITYYPKDDQAETTVNIPVKVSYFLDGEASGTDTVDAPFAVAKAGEVVPGFDPDTGVSTKGNDGKCLVNDEGEHIATVTVPTETNGITYEVSQDGTPITGTNNVYTVDPAKDVQVKAIAPTGKTIKASSAGEYSLNTDKTEATWTIPASKLTCTDPVTPNFNPNTGIDTDPNANKCDVNGTITITAQDGVKYTVIGGTAVDGQEGKYTFPLDGETPVQVKAEPEAGYKFPAETAEGWTLDGTAWVLDVDNAVDEDCVVEPGDPSGSNPSATAGADGSFDCSAKPSVTITEQAGVIYSYTIDKGDTQAVTFTNGKAVIEYEYGQQVVVTAAADTDKGYSLKTDAQASWTFNEVKNLENCPVDPTKPTSGDQATETTPAWQNQVTKAGVPVTAENVGEDLPDGSKVSASTGASGWTVTTDQEGNVTVTPPSFAETGDKATIEVVVEYPDGSSDVEYFTVTVKNDDTTPDDPSDDPTDADETTPAWENAETLPGVPVDVPNNGDNLPGGSKVDAEAGDGWDVTADGDTITVTPAADAEPGDKTTVTVTVTYPDGSKDTETFTVTVVTPPDWPNTDTDPKDPTGPVEVTPTHPENIPDDDPNNPDDGVEVLQDPDDPGTGEVDPDNPPTIDPTTGKVTVDPADDSKCGATINMIVRSKESQVVIDKFTVTVKCTVDPTKDLLTAIAKANDPGKCLVNAFITLPEQLPAGVQLKVESQGKELNADEAGHYVYGAADEARSATVTATLAEGYSWDPAPTAENMAAEGAEVQVEGNAIMWTFKAEASNGYCENGKHDPGYDDGETEPGKPIVIEQTGDPELPEGTTCEITSEIPAGWKAVLDPETCKLTVTPPDTAKPGEKITVEVTFTYPDGSKDTDSVTVTIAKAEEPKDGRHPDTGSHTMTAGLIALALMGAGAAAVAIRGRRREA